MTIPAEFHYVSCFDVVGSSHCVTESDGLKVSEIISIALRMGVGVNLSFLNVETLCPSFIYGAIGKIYFDFSDEVLAKKLVFVDLADEDKRLIDRVVSTFKNSFRNGFQFDVNSDYGDSEFDIDGSSIDVLIKPEIGKRVSNRRVAAKNIKLANRIKSLESQARGHRLRFKKLMGDYQHLRMKHSSLSDKYVRLSENHELDKAYADSLYNSTEYSIGRCIMRLFTPFTVKIRFRK